VSGEFAPAAEWAARGADDDGGEEEGSAHSLAACGTCVMDDELIYFVRNEKLVPLPQ
jgi:hypothetical protein